MKPTNGDDVPAFSFSWDSPPAGEEMVLATAPRFLGQNGSDVELNFPLAGTPAELYPIFEQVFGTWVATRFDQWYKSSAAEPGRVSIYVDVLIDGAPSDGAEPFVIEHG